MNYQELIDNIRDLGFSDDTEMEEFGELLYNSINRAITDINLNVAPIISKYEFEIEKTDTGLLYITIPEIDENFLDFGDTPVLFAQGDTELYKRFNDYEIESGDTVIIDADNTYGEFRIFYKAEHEHFTGIETQLAEEIPLPLRAHFLVPLLAAYYVWLEDEPSKAAQYYNLYEQKAASLIAQTTDKIRMRVLKGGI